MILLNYAKVKGKSLLAITGLSFCSLCLAQMDVDDADTLDFESFHSEKKEAVKIWSKDSGLRLGKEPEKVFEQQPAKTEPAAPSAPAAQTSKQQSASVLPPEKLSQHVSGKRYEVRARYTLNRSANTPYSAFYVIEKLHQQMAELCPQGWKKLAEKSVPVEADFYLHYEFECL